MSDPNVWRSVPCLLLCEVNTQLSSHWRWDVVCLAFLMLMFWLREDGWAELGRGTEDSLQLSNVILTPRISESLSRYLFLWCAQENKSLDMIPRSDVSRTTTKSAISSWWLLRPNHPQHHGTWYLTGPGFNPRTVYITDIPEAQEVRWVNNEAEVIGAVKAAALKKRGWTRTEEEIQKIIFKSLDKNVKDQIGYRTFCIPAIQNALENEDFVCVMDGGKQQSKIWIVSCLTQASYLPKFVDQFVGDLQSA